MDLLDVLFRLTDALAPRRHTPLILWSDAPADNRGQIYGIASVDIIETPKSYSFILDVSGLSKSDIQILLEEEILVLKSNDKRKREEEEDAEVKYLRMERTGMAKFQQKFRLPADANAEAIKASCESGVLTVTVEKVAV